MVGSAPPERFGRAAFDAVQQVDTREYYEHTQPGGSRYIRRDAQGRFTSNQVDVGRSLSADRRRKAKTKARKGMKDRGD